MFLYGYVFLYRLLINREDKSIDIIGLGGEGRRMIVYGDMNADLTWDYISVSTLDTMYINKEVFKEWISSLYSMSDEVVDKALAFLYKLIGEEKFWNGLDDLYVLDRLYHRLTVTWENAMNGYFGHVSKLENDIKLNFESDLNSAYRLHNEIRVSGPGDICPYAVVGMKQGPPRKGSEFIKVHQGEDEYFLFVYECLGFLAGKDPEGEEFNDMGESWGCFSNCINEWLRSDSAVNVWDLEWCIVSYLNHVHNYIVRNSDDIKDVVDGIKKGSYDLMEYVKFCDNKD